MNCYKCGKKLRPMATILEYQDENNQKIYLILGRCDICDSNVTWERDEKGVEDELKPFFFG